MAAARDESAVLYTRELYMVLTRKDIAETIQKHFLLYEQHALK